MLLTAIRKEKEALKQEGEVIGIQKTAINMIKKNFDSKTIYEITSLDIEKIEELRKQVNEK